MKRKITLLLVAAIALLVIAGTKISKLVNITTLPTNSLFVVVTGTTVKATRSISASNLAFGLGPWITNAGASGGPFIRENAGVGTNNTLRGVTNLNATIRGVDFATVIENAAGTDLATFGASDLTVSFPQGISDLATVNGLTLFFNDGGVVNTLGIGPGLAIVGTTLQATAGAGATNAIGTISENTVTKGINFTIADFSTTDSIKPSISSNSQTATFRFDIIDGAKLTNLVIRGMTNTGSFSNSGAAYVGGASTFHGTVTNQTNTTSLGTNLVRNLHLTGGQVGSSLARFDGGTNLQSATTGNGLAFSGVDLTVNPNLNQFDLTGGLLNIENGALFTNTIHRGLTNLSGGFSNSPQAFFGSAMTIHGIETNKANVRIEDSALFVTEAGQLGTEYGNGIITTHNSGANGLTVSSNLLTSGTNVATWLRVPGNGAAVGYVLTAQDSGGRAQWATNNALGFHSDQFVTNAGIVSFREGAKGTNFDFYNITNRGALTNQGNAGVGGNLLVNGNATVNSYLALYGKLIMLTTNLAYTGTTVIFDGTWNQAVLEITNNITLLVSNVFAGFPYQLLITNKGNFTVSIPQAAVGQWQSQIMPQIPSNQASRLLFERPEYAGGAVTNFWLEGGDFELQFASPIVAITNLLSIPPTITVSNTVSLVSNYPALAVGALTVSNKLRMPPATIEVTTTNTFLNLETNQNFILLLMTNTTLVFTNQEAGIIPGSVIIQQDTNGQHTINLVRVAGGVLHTNGSWFLDTNANALGWFQFQSAVFGTNIVISPGNQINIRTNGTLVGSASDVNFTPGVSGSISGTTVTIGGPTVGTVSGAGSGSTNYLLNLAATTEFYLGSSNVHIYTVTGGTFGSPVYWNAFVTNLSADTWGINFASGTNRWKFSGVYGTNAPSVLTNNTLLQLSGRSDGTNTLVGYTYYRPGL